MGWRLAESLAVLLAQINQARPDRDKGWDSTIGDARHQATHSDHNQDRAGIVHAMDVTHDPSGGFDSYKFADYLREHWDDRLQYVISNDRIANIDVGGGKWRDYHGSNKHDHHVHISVRTDDRADRTTSWDVAAFFGVEAPASSAPSPAPAVDPPPLDAVLKLAAESDLARYNWPGRGRAPIGYVKGMAAAYAMVLGKLKAGDSAALSMVRIVNDGHDVFDHYQPQIRAAGLQTAGASGIERLRVLWTIMTGLGMRESSGRYCEGRDRSASNTTAETAEAGLFQMSWDGRKASPEIEKLLRGYSADEFVSPVNIFAEGVTPRRGDLDNYGSGDGLEFQRLCKERPEFAVMTAAIGLRTLYTHWGPIVRHEAKIVPAAYALYMQIDGGAVVA